MLLLPEMPRPGDPPSALQKGDVLLQDRQKFRVVEFVVFRVPGLGFELYCIRIWGVGLGARGIWVQHSGCTWNCQGFVR